MFTAIVLGAAAAVAAFAVYYFVSQYRVAIGSVWQRLISAAKNSATMLWQYVIVAASYVLVWADYGAGFFGLPEVQKFLADNVTPTRMGIVMMVIAVITILARLRSLGAR